MIFATLLALHAADGVHLTARAAAPAAARMDRKWLGLDRADALAFYRNLFSRLETVDLDDPVALSTSLGVRFVQDPSYEASRPEAPYRHWLAILPAASNRPATRIEYCERVDPRGVGSSVSIMQLGQRFAQADLLSVYSAKSVRSTAISGPPTADFIVPDRANEIILYFAQREPHLFRAAFFRSRRVPGTN